MKTQHISLLLASGLAIGMLSSCIAPVPTYGQTSVTTTSYQPGYQLSSLPSGYRSEVISGNNYYYNNGAYYRRDSGGYVVVDAPRTSRYYNEYSHHHGSGTTTTYRDQPNGGVNVITRLPSGYRVVNHSGNQYYQSGDRFYRRQGSGYIVVNRPY